MYEFWYDLFKPKYGKKANLCYIDTNSFIVCIKIYDIYKDIADSVETRFNTSIYELECNFIERPLRKGLIKDELCRTIMTKFVGLREKIYKYLIDDGSEEKKAKDINKYVIIRKLKFQNYENCNKEFIKNF